MAIKVLKIFTSLPDLAVQLEYIYKIFCHWSYARTASGSEREPSCCTFKYWVGVTRRVRITNVSTIIGEMIPGKTAGAIIPTVTVYK